MLSDSWALIGLQLSQHNENSHVIWDNTVLPVTRQRPRSLLLLLHWHFLRISKRLAEFEGGTVRPSVWGLESHVTICENVEEYKSKPSEKEIFRATDKETGFDGNDAELKRNGVTRVEFSDRTTRQSAPQDAIVRRTVVVE